MDPRASRRQARRVGDERTSLGRAFLLGFAVGAAQIVTRDWILGFGVDADAPLMVRGNAAIAAFNSGGEAMLAISAAFAAGIAQFVVPGFGYARGRWRIGQVVVFVIALFIGGAAGLVGAKVAEERARAAEQVETARQPAAAEN